jgi:hypothetical protein
MKPYPRAYLLWNGQYKHIHLVGKSVQTTLGGDPVDMVTFKITPSTKITYSVEAKQLLTSKPRKARAR